MYVTLQMATVVLVSIAMALSLAHALELPGKMRLDREHYLAVQPIYYPGFTVGGGVGEVGGLAAALVLLLATPRGPSFWLTLAAITALLAVQAIFWTMTQPVNRAWLRETQLSGPAERFFGTRGGTGPEVVADWTILRDRWERSHLLRAAFAMLAFVLLVTAVAL